MPRKYTMRSKEEKLSIVKRNLAGESAMSLAREIGSSDFQVRTWVKTYLLAARFLYVIAFVRLTDHAFFAGGNVDAETLLDTASGINGLAVGGK